MPTKKKIKTKKKPNTNLKFTVSVDWQGEYFQNRDDLCEMFPKYESGSGVGINGNDCSFSNIPSKDLIRVIATIKEFWRKNKRERLFFLQHSIQGSHPCDCHDKGIL